MRERERRRQHRVEQCRLLSDFAKSSGKEKRISTRKIRCTHVRRSDFPISERSIGGAVPVDGNATAAGHNVIRKNIDSPVDRRRRRVGPSSGTAARI